LWFYNFMATRDRVVVNPLFFEALSGSFRAPQGSKSSLRNLGELMIETYQLGSLTVLGAETRRYEALVDYAYTPSWAEGSDVHVTCRRRANISRVTEISLHNHNSVLELHDRLMDGNGVDEVEMTINKEGTRSMALEQGLAMLIVQRVIAAEALKIFS
jgi:hypothetical protein